ncbi:putative methyltransferase-like protein C27D7.08c [Yarrowia sp. C11]|nr:putative methyltransferase-like protein C27D7.08c [Yarrowia sp. E02]KAG5369417.1 putative methyltransferase-like protein C27D7.08c [Yarrowia sp. C11]
MERDHGLHVVLDPERLCPRVPIRLAYIEWIRHLLSEELEAVVGLDVGTGTSCIYPLLASKLYGWKMIGSDIDPEAVEKAQENVERNPDVIELITVKLVSSQSDFFAFSDDICFTMCNPPFYASVEEMQTSVSKKKSRPAGELKAVQNELITEDGELGFLLRMISDSKRHKNIVWFTSMMGKKETMEKVCEELKKEKIYHSVVSRRPGKTKRWFVAWTFTPEAKHEQVSGNYNLEAVEKLLVNNDIPFKKSQRGLVATPKGDIWSRKYKRAKLRKEAVELKDQYEFLVTEKTLTWKRGTEKMVWDSFSSWITRNLKESRVVE